MTPLYFLCGIFFWATVLIILPLSLCKFSPLHKGLFELNRIGNILLCLAILSVILLCTIPMKLSPSYNGYFGMTQYEKFTESLLEGRIDTNCNLDDTEIMQLENLYNYPERDDSGLHYHFDESFYKGKYYMYFGPVPAFLVFLPYRLITGHPLATYHACQIFAGLFIIGMFALFRELSKKFYREISVGLYLFVTTSLAMISTWYVTAAPSVYCTPIISGMAIMTWSIYFYFKGIYVEEREKLQILYAFFGGFLGALSVGCRPSIGMANLVALPLVYVFVKEKHKKRERFLYQIIAATVPYLVIGVLLMYYNYIRFESPFEFGQTYMLTVADLTPAGGITVGRPKTDIIHNALYFFFQFGGISEEFPYINFGGVFMNFPILLIAFGIFNRGIYAKLKETNLQYMCYTIMAFMPILALVEASRVHKVIERYRMDAYYLIAIVVFIVIISWVKLVNDRKRFTFKIGVICIFSVLMCFIFFLRPYDGDWAYVYPEDLARVQRVLFLGFK